MTRYQIYLQPDTVQTLDELSKELYMSRSQIIRDVLDRMALQYSKILIKRKRKTKENPLLKLIGIEKAQRINIAENVDEIYLRD